MYNHEDANSVTSKGTEMMQAWLDNNDPNAKWAEMICDVFPDCFTKNGAAFNLIADEE